MTLIFIVGATATGKSDLAIKVAQKLQGEVVNADSMQLYKGMDIGTAKLSKNERQGIERSHAHACLGPARRTRRGSARAPPEAALRRRAGARPRVDA